MGAGCFCAVQSAWSSPNRLKKPFGAALIRSVGPLDASLSPGGGSAGWPSLSWTDDRSLEVAVLKAGKSHGSVSGLRSRSDLSSASPASVGSDAACRPIGVCADVHSRDFLRPREPGTRISSVLPKPRLESDVILRTSTARLASGGHTVESPADGPLATPGSEVRLVSRTSRAEMVRERPFSGVRIES